MDLSSPTARAVSAKRRFTRCLVLSICVKFLIVALVWIPIENEVEPIREFVEHLGWQREQQEHHSDIITRHRREKGHLQQVNQLHGPTLEERKVDPHLGFDPADFKLAPPSNSIKGASHWKKFFIAFNMYNNEHLIHRFTADLKTFLVQYLLPFYKPQDIFVSVLENGSSDRTPLWLKEVLQPMLEELHIPHLVRTNASIPCTGRPKKGDQQNAASTVRLTSNRKIPEIDRIEWMACIRNEAIFPLRDQGVGLFAQRRAHEEGDLDRLTRGISPDDVEKAAALSPDDVAVLFFNDVIFNPVDLVRLLVGRNGRYDMMCAMDFYYTFYDTWVSRDATGGMFSPYYPYGRDPMAAAGVERGFPFPAKCCWNGVLVISGHVFMGRHLTHHTLRLGQTRQRQQQGAMGTQKGTQADSNAAAANSPGSPTEKPIEEVLVEFVPGISFRANKTETTCYAAECQLLCEDMLANNWDNIYIHPLVKVAYEEWYFDLHHRPTAWQRLVLWFLRWLYRSDYGEGAKLAEHSPQGLECVTPDRVKTTHVSLVSALTTLVGIAAVLGGSLKAVFPECPSRWSIRPLLAVWGRRRWRTREVPV